MTTFTIYDRDPLALFTALHIAKQIVSCGVEFWRQKYVNHLYYLYRWYTLCASVRVILFYLDYCFLAQTITGHAQSRVLDLRMVIQQLSQLQVPFDLYIHSILVIQRNHFKEIDGI